MLLFASFIALILRHKNYTSSILSSPVQAATRDLDLQDHETPKFYKKDLLAVLKEKNELKEEYDALRDELSLAKASVELYLLRDKLDMAW